MDRTSQPKVHNTIVGGVVAGSVAAAALTSMMTIMSLARGNDPWYGMKGAAAPFIGERAMGGGFDFAAVSLGLTCHLLVSMAWGLGFAFLFDGMRKGVTLVAGLVWGFVVWIGMFYIVLPMVGLAQMTVEAPVGRTIAYHLFFGLAVAASYLGWETEEDRHADQRRRIFREAHA